MIYEIPGKDKVIICPHCHRFLTKAKAEDNRWHKLKHKKCGKWIWFIPATNKFEIHEVPLRQQISGVRFY